LKKFLERGCQEKQNTGDRWQGRSTCLAHELRPLHLVFSRKDIIKIMTRNAAAVIGRSKDLGTLEPGKLCRSQGLEPYVVFKAQRKPAHAIGGEAARGDRR